MATLFSLRATVLTATILAAGSVAHAQNAPAAAPAAPAAAPAAAAAAAPADNPWNKICGEDQRSKKQVCLTVRELRTDNGQFLASAGSLGLSGWR